jgi:hypothetical protein
MQQLVGLSINGLASVANIAGFTKVIVDYSITLNTSSPSSMAVSITPRISLASHRCNLHKGPNPTGIDSSTAEVAPLFHPRPMAGPLRFPGLVH